MGNFDKVVVLVVLFLVAIVLGVSLNGKDPGEAAGPGGELAGGPGGDPSLDADEGGPGATGPLGSLRGDGAERGGGPSEGLMHVGVGDDETGLAGGAADPNGARAQNAGLQGDGSRAAGPGPEAPDVEPGPNGAEVPDALSDVGRVRILRTEVGLQRTSDDTYRLYTWQAGDSWSTVASRLYSRSSLASRLRNANDRNVAPRPGEQILVPVYDQTREGTSRAPARPVARGTEGTATDGGGGRIDAPTTSGSGPEKEETPPSSDASRAEFAANGGWTTVQPGETLSHVSLRVYGSTKHYQKIFEANTDEMPDVDTLREGQRLRIPALSGALPAAERGRVQ